MIHPCPRGWWGWGLACCPRTGTPAKTACPLCPCSPGSAAARPSWSCPCSPPAGQPSEQQWGLLCTVIAPWLDIAKTSKQKTRQKQHYNNNKKKEEQKTLKWLNGWDNFIRGMVNDAMIYSYKGFTSTGSINDFKSKRFYCTLLNDQGRHQGSGKNDIAFWPSDLPAAPCGKRREGICMLVDLRRTQRFSTTVVRTSKTSLLICHTATTVWSGRMMKNDWTEHKLFSSLHYIQLDSC